jgi:quercetin dioxygenase-like cupin family protein
LASWADFITTTPELEFSVHTAVYFHQGTDLVTNEDGTSKTFHPGDTTAEGVNTVHWHKNTGDDNVVIYTADLVKAPAK